MTLENTFILDPEQLKRIEGVHRGFLYQHLYAAGCLFLAPTSGVTSLLVEKDEDIELLFRDHHIYIQVKTRSERLRTSDISNTLSQFSKLREAHADKQRLLSPQFWIVSNMEPGPQLLKQANSSDWVKDIFLLWPECSHDSPIAMPPAWPNLLDAIKWCIEKAQCVPFTRLSGETLVWKLAALIEFACTGSSSQMYHEFRSEDLPELFEQMVIQLQDFPKSPLSYRPQQSEPDLKSEAAVRLIIGFSGAGKTAWSSQLAMHNSDTMAYYDISDTPDQNLASSLTRELAARFLGKLKDGISTVLLPGMTGLDSLRALGKLLHMRGIQATVIIDNVHRVAPSEIRSILQAAPTLRYVLLARPWIGQQELEALLNIHAEVLGGWSTDTIAAEFAESGCVIDPAASSRILKLTGGLPLYVRNAAALAKEHYQGDARRFCDSIEAKQHVMPTAQEAILSQIIDTITSTARDTLALLSLVDVPLTVQEACSLLCSPLGISNDVAHRALRELSRIGVVEQLKDERLVIHEAFRLLAGEHQTRMPEAIIRTAHLKLRNILEDSIKTKHDVSRISLFLRLLPITGETASLVDLASSEFFIELGFEKELRSVLEKAASAEDLSPLDRFWAMDSLAFWDLHNDNLTSVILRLSRMEELLTAIENGKKERLNLLMKKMLLSAKQGDLKSARTVFLEACGYQDDEQSRRILCYNYAVALCHAGAYRESEEEAYSLVIEYYGVLGLSPEDVFAKNPAEIVVKLTDIGEQQDDLKHLADSLDLYAKSRNAQNKDSGLARLHALKFYDMSNAVRSAVRVGQDVVDEQLSILHDPIAARQFMEQTLLPIIQTYKLFDYVVPVRAQYAVALAYCGETDKANAEMRSLAPFEGALPDDRRKEMQNQKRLINKIAEGTVRIGPRLHLSGQPSGVAMMTRSKRRIGRNEPCPCGSGKKYKKCCGK